MTVRSGRGFRRGRRVLVAGVALAVLGLAAPATAAPATSSADAAHSSSADAIADVVRNAMAEEHLRAVLVKVTRGDEVLTSAAFGTSMDGVPASTDMHVRNGAIAFTYLGTLLVKYVDDGRVGLDDTIGRWMPTLPAAELPSGR